jgi:hypothetical protein
MVCKKKACEPGRPQAKSLQGGSEELQPHYSHAFPISIALLQNITGPTLRHINIAFRYAAFASAQSSLRNGKLLKKAQ